MSEALVVIDFERVPGESRECTLGHVRAGKEVFRKEIVDSGLTFVEEVKICRQGFKARWIEVSVDCGYSK